MNHIKHTMNRQLLIISIAIIFVAILGITFSYFAATTMPLSIMLVIISLISYFGVLNLPGGWCESQGFSESRIRLAIASSLLIVYLVYFSTVIFWQNPDKIILPKLAETMIETLTNLLMVVLPFYFGSTAAVEILKGRSENRNEDKKSPGTQ